MESIFETMKQEIFALVHSWMFLYYIICLGVCECVKIRNTRNEHRMIKLFYFPLTNKQLTFKVKLCSFSFKEEFGFQHELKLCSNCFVNIELKKSAKFFLALIFIAC